MVNRLIEVKNSVVLDRRRCYCLFWFKILISYLANCKFGIFREFFFSPNIAYAKFRRHFFLY